MKDVTRDQDCNQEQFQETWEEQETTGLEVAVIGMAGRFPGAADIHQFWDNLKNGVESIRFFTPEELIEDGTDKNLLEHPNFVPAKGSIEGIEYFDAAFFGYTPKEADLMNPQMRILHEVTLEVLENAAYSPANYDGPIGLFAGWTPNLQWDAGNTFFQGTGTEVFSVTNLNSNFFTTLIAYRLNLKGPAVSLQTACSTSLTAIHTACRSLITGECDMAVAGGVTIDVPQKTGYIYQDGMIVSPDGHCRAFDAAAKGTVTGNGIGLVALKLLTDAMEDNDHIYAIIKGSAINNDGNRKVGYTAPSIEGQKEVISAALRMAEVEPETVTYVETHGTGTVLGDPVEIEALKLAFNTDKKGFCRIGSVKSNIGHLDSAAGAAGFIKTVLALKHRQIPPSLHFRSPNPAIDFENSPFMVNSQLTDWKTGGSPLRAGVSAFGIGGTNAHIILEEAPRNRPESSEEESRSTGRRCQLIPLSAKTESALQRAAQNLGNHLKVTPEVELSDVAYTMQVGRTAFEYRRVQVCTTLDEAREALEKTADDGVETWFFNKKKGDKRVVFLFPGQGSQYVRMGEELYRTEPLFKTEMDRCFEILNPLMGIDVGEILYPGDGAAHAQRAPEEEINRTEITQPVIFALEYSLARLLMEWGIRPETMMGHSIGEYTAAALAGVFTLEDALKAVVIRGRLMQKMPSGAMLSIPITEKELEPYLNPDLSLAAANAPGTVVVSGTHDAILKLADQLKEKELQTRKLHTSHAFHSRMMEPVLEEFQRQMEAIPMAEPRIPFISNLTGHWITMDDAVSPGYWARHLRETVRFSDGVTQLLDDPSAIFIEVGPGRTLSTFVSQHKQRSAQQQTVNLIRHPREKMSDSRYLMGKLGKLWMYGVSIDWNAFHGGQRHNRVPLPSYPFAKQAFNSRINLNKMIKSVKGTSRKEGKRSEISKWFYTPLWIQSLPPEATKTPASALNWLQFSNGEPWQTQLRERLVQQGSKVIVVEAGPFFQEREKPGGNSIEENSFIINPRRDEDVVNLFQRLKEMNFVPHRILHQWTAQSAKSEGLQQDDLERIVDLGFYSMLNIAAATGNVSLKQEMEIIAITANHQSVTGDEDLRPEAAAMVGAVRVIPREYPNIRCRIVDIEPPETGGVGEQRLLDRLIQELTQVTHEAGDPDGESGNETSGDVPMVAYRGSRRWRQVLRPVRLEKNGQEQLQPHLKEGGVYLVTGGMGGIGFTLAEELALKWRSKLILTGRTPFPEPGQWDQWLQQHPTSDPVSGKIRIFREWQANGADIIPAIADVADYEQMKNVVIEAKERFGRIDGIIHSAGLADYAGLIQRRTRETTDPVLAPKIIGTQVLDRLIEDESLELDFLVLCSSLSATQAPFGQVGYTAANAFLDSYAQYDQHRRGRHTVAVAWDTWRDTGMAVEAVRRLTDGDPPAANTEPGNIDNVVLPEVEETVGHPLFHHHREEGPGKTVYVSYLGPGSHWVLDEHRIMGNSTLPGTAYLEMARAAVEHLHTHVNSEPGSESVQIENFSFVAPLVIPDGRVREVQTVLERRKDNTNTYKVTIQVSGEPGRETAVSGKEKSEPRILAQGNIGKPGALTTPPAGHSIEILEGSVNRKEIVIENGDNAGTGNGFVAAGPRWQSMKRYRFGETEGLGWFQLPEAFESDLEEYALHPALLDRCVSPPDGNVADGAYLLPFSYRRLNMYRPLSKEIVAHTRLTDDGGNRCYDVVLMNPDGEVMVEIEGYTLRKVAQTEPAEPKPEPKPAGDQTPVHQLLQDGITNEEGVDVFYRILAAGLPQLLISTTDLKQRGRRVQGGKETEKKEKPDTVMDLADEIDDDEGHPRPELSTPYVPPVTDSQKKLARIWQSLMGIGKIGINDDFFELGGDSLKALTINTMVEKHLGVDVSLAEFFNAPTIGDLAAFVDGAGQHEHQGIEAAEKMEYYPLSSAQKRLYILYQMNPHSRFYNIPSNWKLEGKLDVPQFMKALEQIVQRHESFRTSFHLLGEKTVQMVHEEVDFKVEYHDLTRCRREEDQSPWEMVELYKVIKTFSRPFDLSQAPLIRACLVMVEENRYLWMLDVHHIITDASGYAILEKEIFQLYNRQELPPLKVQYKDYSVWHDRMIEEGAMKEHEDYWMGVYPDESSIPDLQLPTDYPRPAVRSFEGEIMPFDLGPEQTAMFLEVGEELRTTLFMKMLAVLSVQLYRYTGQEDIVVGTSIAGRQHADLHELIGMFVNMLAVRNKPKGEQTFLEYLETVKERVLEAFAHQDMQFEQLVDRLGLEKSTSRNPIFDVAINVQNYEQPTFDTEPQELRISPYGIEYKAAKFDLLLWVNQVGERFVFQLEYSTELFKSSTAEEFARHFLEVLNQVAETPDIKLKEIQLSHQLVYTETEAPEIEFGF
jgi:acyl transferase domain-containing protein/acyl carrier protein